MLLLSLRRSQLERHDFILPRSTIHFETYFKKTSNPACLALTPMRQRPIWRW